MSLKCISKACFFLFAIALVHACSQSTPPGPELPPGFNPPKVLKPDSIAAKLEPAILQIESRNLQLGGYKLRHISIDSITYSMVSMNDYLLNRKAELEANLAISNDKEKTGKAIRYLERIAKEAPVKKEVYKISYHMNAQAGEYIYNERHFNYLNPDLSELHIRFPDM
jgi:hypothetical protein